MKTKNATNLVVGIVLTLVTIIMVGIVILWGTGYFGQNKKTLDRSTAKIDGAINAMSEFDLQIYQDKIIRGDVLVDLIQELKKDKVMVSIGVTTLGGEKEGVQYNYRTSTIDKTDGTAEITPSPAATAVIPEGKGSLEYINPNGSFKGTVVRDKNDEIVLIGFTQQP
ncbi:hypothetical protein HNQ56_000956 [Anaerotaenia torta]|uniref:hypothetical protein n=1 Tax=Anaerotaenia torta TaxID=433293 RepID=UPI003D1A5100